MSSIILGSVTTLFLLIFVGFIAGKQKIVSEKFTQDMSSILVKIALPATIISSMIRPYNNTLLADSGKIFLFTLIVHIFCICVSYYGTKSANIPQKDRGVWIFVSTFSNNGFMGFPLAYAVFGNDGLFLASVSNMISNILIFSIGVKILTIGYKSTVKIDYRKIFINNVNIAVIFGLFFYITQLKPPQPVMNTIKYLGSVTAPLSMFIVGISISKSRVVEMFKDYRLYFLSAIRLLAVPFLAILVLHLLIPGTSAMVEKVFILVLAMPAPSSTTMISEQYNSNSLLSSKSIFVTTLLSIATIPLVMLFI